MTQSTFCHPKEECPQWAMDQGSACLRFGSQTCSALLFGNARPLMKSSDKSRSRKPDFYSALPQNSVRCSLASLENTSCDKACGVAEPLLSVHGVPQPEWIYLQEKHRFCRVFTRGRGSRGAHEPK